jgi:hypothetical protein
LRRTISIWTPSDSESERKSSPSGEISFTGSYEVADLNLRLDAFSALETRLATAHDTHLYVDWPSTIRYEYSVSLILRQERWNLEPQGLLYPINFCLTWNCTPNISPCWQP